MNPRDANFGKTIKAFYMDNNFSDGEDVKAMGKDGDGADDDDVDEDEGEPEITPRGANS